MYVCYSWLRNGEKKANIFATLSDVDAARDAERAESCGRIPVYITTAEWLQCSIYTKENIYMYEWQGSDVQNSNGYVKIDFFLFSQHPSIRSETEFCRLFFRSILVWQREKCTDFFENREAREQISGETRTRRDFEQR